jgi:hypothetical protein
MARKAGQIIARGASTWLVRIYLGAIFRWARANTMIKPIHDCADLRRAGAAVSVSGIAHNFREADLNEASWCGGRVRVADRVFVGVEVGCVAEKEDSL